MKLLVQTIGTFINFYLFFLKKKMKFKSWVISSLTGISINAYNFIVFYIALLNASQTKTLIFIIILNVMLYNSIYFILKKKIR